MVSISGTYIAAHPWIVNSIHAYKIGHTGDLRRRLHDSAYVTCFSDEWVFHAAFETETKKDAARLEAAVLHIFRDVRLSATSELVKLPAADIASMCERTAHALKINIVRKDFPVYARRDGITDIGAATGSDLILSADDLRALGAITRCEPDQAEKRISLFEEVVRRDYQIEAVERCLVELRREKYGKTIAQVACRCGKTLIAYDIAMEMVKNPQGDNPQGDNPQGKNILFIVPGLELLKQTALKLAHYNASQLQPATSSADFLLIGSDSRGVVINQKEHRMVTDEAAVRSFLENGADRIKIVVCTYQSSEIVGPFSFALTIFDECHRVCGASNAKGGGLKRQSAEPMAELDEEVRAFAKILLSPPTGARLFMTATPVYTEDKKVSAPSITQVTMSNRELFGGVAFRYHLRAGINANHVNYFKIALIANRTCDSKLNNVYALPCQIVEAMSMVDKLLVFCRDTKHASDLADEVQKACLADPTIKPFACLEAHSRMAGGSASESLTAFSESGTRAALFNCRMFQEGVEIPELNGVFFAAPRQSPRDIIQSLCRPLNKYSGKPDSYVFIPVHFNGAEPLDSPANLGRFATIIPFTDALLNEDPQFFDTLMTDSGQLSFRTCKSFEKTEPACIHAKALSSVRKAIRYTAGGADRLASKIPWEKVLAEIRRIVVACNRYPKTTDAWVITPQCGADEPIKVCLHRYYRNIAEDYLKAESVFLEPHQKRDLESLPGWLPFGVEGPYPWKLCIRFLTEWLEKYGEAPMLEINKGGYTGLDASMMERLSGAMTCVNQGVFGKKVGGVVKAANRIDAEHAKDLDDLCKRFSLRDWRKRFKADGTVDEKQPTFIQEAFSRFKEYYKENGPQGEYIQEWFKDYPAKHSRQESLSVQAAKTAPLKWKSVRK